MRSGGGWRGGAENAHLELADCGSSGRRAGKIKYLALYEVCQPLTKSFAA